MATKKKTINIKGAKAILKKRKKDAQKATERGEKIAVKIQTNGLLFHIQTDWRYF